MFGPSQMSIDTGFFQAEASFTTAIKCFRLRERFVVVIEHDGEIVPQSIAPTGIKIMIHEW